MNARFYLAALAASSLIFAAPTVSAQPNTPVRVQGRVTDAETGVPLMGAHVFIAGSMVGTTTDSDGRYTLDRLPTGAHRLYVSMLGFEPDFKDVMLRASRVYTFDFELNESIIQAGEILVEADRDDKWPGRLEKFTRMFIGETPFAAETDIINPEVLDFVDSRGSFEAMASEPLIIENRALGYRITYFLKDFKSTPMRIQYDGEPLFEELQPSSLAELEQWEENRKAAFMGSFRHFALALLSGRVEAQGFKTYSRPTAGNRNAGSFGGGQAFRGNERFPLDSATLLTPGESEGEFILDFQGHVEIVYMGETEHPLYLSQGNSGDQDGRRRPSFQTSWVTMERGPTVLDYKGDLLDPYGITFSGYMAWQRVADEVPKEYRPG